MAAFFDEDGALSLTRVTLVDTSDGGLGMVSPVDVERGARFCLYSESMPLPHRTGVVEWSRAHGEDWRVGLRCDDERWAA